MRVRVFCDGPSRVQTEQMRGLSTAPLAAHRRSAAWPAAMARGSLGSGGGLGRGLLMEPAAAVVVVVVDEEGGSVLVREGLTGRGGHDADESGPVRRPPQQHSNLHQFA